MSNNNYLKDNLVLAELRCLDKDNNVEDKVLSYGVFYKSLKDKEVTYTNVLNESDEYPVLEYNTNNEFNSMKCGPCWVVTESFEGNGIDSIINQKVIEDIVLSSDKFFIDRIKIIKNDLYNKTNLFKKINILNKDLEKIQELDNYLNQKELEYFDSTKIKRIK